MCIQNKSGTAYDSGDDNGRIEYFVGLRRLGKEAWFLNYNGEPHWPVKYQNRKDFNIRMEQFFDHFLMGKDKPEWMQKGIPAIEKGINSGY